MLLCEPEEGLTYTSDMRFREINNLEHLDVVHVELPVLDVAAVVAGHHPSVVVTPLHRSHRGVVGLGKKYIPSQQNK